MAVKRGRRKEEGGRISEEGESLDEEGGVRRVE
jgi:hypothetical protein